MPRTPRVRAARSRAGAYARALTLRCIILLDFRSLARVPLLRHLFRERLAVFVQDAIGVDRKKTIATHTGPGRIRRGRIAVCNRGSVAGLGDTIEWLRRDLEQVAGLFHLVAAGEIGAEKGVYGRRDRLPQCRPRGRIFLVAE